MARPKPYNPVAPRTPKQLRQAAAQQVTAALTPERQAIIAAQKAAQRSAAQQQQRIAGFSQAGAKLLGEQLAPTATAYTNLVGEQKGLASGFSQGMQERLANIPGAQGTATADAVYALGGLIPGEQLSTNAAAAYADAVRQPATQLGLGQLGLRSAASTAQEQNRQYLDKLIGVAGKRPALYQAALDALQKGELQKLATRADLQAIGFKESEAAWDRRKESAALYGYDPITHEPTVAQKRLDAAKAKAEKSGTVNIDTSQSQLRGWLVRKDGSYYIDPATKQRVKVPKKKTGGAGAGGTEAERHPYQAAVDRATELRGQPVELSSTLVETAARRRRLVGTYIADPRFVGHKGGKGPWNVIPPHPGMGIPATTNDPKLARRDTQFNVYQAINLLMSRYGLTRPRARQALAAAGWFTGKTQ